MPRTYLWSAVRAQNHATRFVLDDPDTRQEGVLAELVAPKFADRWISIHGSGDYSTRWLRIG